MPLPLLIGAIGALAAGGGAMANRADDQRIERQETEKRYGYADTEIAALGLGGEDQQTRQMAARDLLASDNPQLQVAGRGYLSAMTQSSMDRAALAAEVGEDQAAKAEADARQAELDLQVSRAESPGEILEAQQKATMLSHEMKAQQLGLPPTPGAPVWQRNQYTGQYQIAEAAGTANMTQLQTALNESAALLGDMNRYAQQFDEYGYEAMNQGKMGSYDAMKGLAMNRVNSMLGAGAITGDDKEIIDSFLPDATGLVAAWKDWQSNTGPGNLAGQGTLADYAKMQLEEVQRFLERKTVDQAKAQPNLYLDYSVLPRLNPDTKDEIVNEWQRFADERNQRDLANDRMLQMIKRGDI
jgi:hypothetical protein